MALTIKYNPDLRYFSAHGDLLFVLYEDTKPYDPTTYPDYKYVCDITIINNAGTQINAARLKAYPMPGTKFGVFNIGNVVRNYIAYVFQPPVNAILCQQFRADTFYVNVVCRFGEEYNFVTYPSLIVDSQRSYFNHYNGRQFGTTTILTAFKDKVLSSRPYETNVDRNATYCFIPFFAGDDSDITLQVKCYNNSLGLIRQVNFVKSPTVSSIDELQQYNLSPSSINTEQPGTIDAIIDYYTVTFSTPNITDDSVFRFNVTCERRYEVQTLHFLNKYGGFESKDFSKLSRKTIETQKLDYGKTPYVIKDDGSVSFFHSGSKVYNEQVLVYASEWSEKMQINTDIISDLEYVWLSELVNSPQVYIQMNGYFYSIKITDTNYEQRKNINDRLTNLTLNLEFGEKFNTQFR